MMYAVNPMYYFDGSCLYFRYALTQMLYFPVSCLYLQICIVSYVLFTFMTVVYILHICVNSNDLFSRELSIFYT